MRQTRQNQVNENNKIENKNDSYDFNNDNIVDDSKNADMQFNIDNFASNNDGNSVKKTSDSFDSTNNKNSDNQSTDDLSVKSDNMEFNMNNFSGGAYLFEKNKSESAYVFIYDHIPLHKIRDILNTSDDLNSMIGEIKDYQLYFGNYNKQMDGAISDIMERSNSTVCGYFMNLTCNHMLILEKYYHTTFDKVLQHVDIYDLTGNKYDGFVFHNENINKMKWISDPSEKYLQSMYRKPLSIYNQI